MLLQKYYQELIYLLQQVLPSDVLLLEHYLIFQRFDRMMSLVLLVRMGRRLKVCLSQICFLLIPLFKLISVMCSTSVVPQHLSRRFPVCLN